MKKLFFAPFFAMCMVALSNTAWSQAAPPYVLDDTAVHSLHAKELKRDYQIMVSLPPSYNSSTRRYPVVFVTDANYAFPLTRSVAKRVGANGRGLEEFILVGLGYATGDTSEFSRRRDYTPVNPPDSNYVSDMPGRTPQFGKAEAYRRFIATDVFPLIAQRYRSDMARKVFVGHSYGSLLGLQVLFTEPSMFDQYILGSPSLWYGKRVMFEREKAFAASHKELKARLYFGVGSLETGPEENMVADLKQFQALLKARHYPGLQIESRVFADEDHLTLAPGLITRGLKWTLPGKK
ncbi:alpha/beta hydrolase [Massilia sp. TSP1-1-2]|uniref:alpha/beta hydrolase n=1 Tax=Massilia sp. TSP1-1-2 TaxID=2804649 RepID=UPI003CF6B6D7